MSCDLYQTMGAVDVLGMSTKCRYHKKKERLETHSLGQRFGCLPLFHTVYPHFLSALYGGTYGPDSSEFKCPGFKSYITVRLHARPIRIWHICLVNSIKKLLHFLYPTDRIEKEVSFTVIDKQGMCPAGYKEGDVYRIDAFSSLCPASAFSIYPELMASDHCAKVQCPSDVNRVTYGKPDINAESIIRT